MSSGQIKPAYQAGSTLPDSCLKGIKHKCEQSDDHYSKRLKPTQSSESLSLEPPPLDRDSAALGEQVRLELLERSQSRYASNANPHGDMSESTTPRSTLSLANYRRDTLHSARIFVQHEKLPDNVQLIVDKILARQPSLDETRALEEVADQIYNDFECILLDASGEEASLSPVHDALRTIHRLVGGVLVCGKNVDLKPTIVPELYRTTHIVEPARANPSSDDPMRGPSPTVPGPLEARESLAAVLDDPGGTMPPPPTRRLPAVKAPAAKTPRPNIFVSFRMAAIEARVRALGVSARQAPDVLRELELRFGLACSPTLTARLAVFPSMVVEGKAYDTGRSMYEAENQAVVSGAYMLYVQHQLAGLVERHVPDAARGGGRRPVPLAFSICHEGPIMCLWVHYNVWIDDLPDYSMRLIAQCHASLKPSVLSFVVALFGVAKWASTELLDEMVLQVFRLWEAE